MLCCFCCLSCVLSGPAFAVGEAPDLDDILQGADPWEDFANVSNALHAVSDNELDISASGLDNDSFSSIEDSSGLFSSEQGGGEGGQEESGEEVGQSGEEGISVYSIPEYSGQRVSILASAGWIFYRSGSETIVPSYNGVRSSTNKYTIASRTSTSSGKRYMSIPACYVDYNLDVEPIDYTPSLPFLSYAGQISGAVSIVGWGIGTTLYFNRVQLLVNGKPVGNAVSLDSSNGGVGTLNGKLDMSASPIDGVITSLGYRFYFDSSKRLPDSGYTEVQNALTVSLLVGDRLTFENIGDSGNGEVVGGLDEVKQEQAKTNGLLGSLIELVKSIVNGLGSIVTAIQNIVNYIIELPGKLVTAFTDMLKTLFVPSTDEMDDLYKKFSTLMSSKLGFIYESFQLVENLFTTIHDGWANHSDYTFEFPGIHIKGADLDNPNKTITLVEEQTIDFDNPVFSTLRNCAGTLASFVCVLASVHAFEMMFIAVISGKNYFEYINAAYDTMESEGLLSDDERV